MGRRKTEFEIIEDFFSDIRVDPETGCYLWQGGLATNGYGVIDIHGKSQLAHRFAWEQQHGPIEDDLIVLHACDTRHCLNTEHMSLGTKKDNTQDMLSKGRENKVAITPKLVTSSELSDMVRMHREGASFYRIAKALGRSSQQLVKAKILKAIATTTQEVSA